MASKAATSAGLPDIPQHLQKGFRKATTPAAIAGVGGVAASGLVPRVVIMSARGLFGVDDGVQHPSLAQRTARLGLQVLMMSIGGAMVVGGKGAARAAGWGVMLTGGWHAVNELGINF